MADRIYGEVNSGPAEGQLHVQRCAAAVPGGSGDRRIGARTGRLYQESDHEPQPDPDPDRGQRLADREQRWPGRRWIPGKRVRRRLGRGGGGGGGGGTAITFPSDAAAYTKAALAAYVAKDVSALDQYEDTGGQLHTMLSCAGCYNTAFTYYNCEGAAGSSYCLFINTVGDELRLRVNNSLLGQPRAMGGGSIFNPIAFPSNDQAYAQEALDAWQTGDDPRLKLLTSAQFTSAQVTAKGANASTTWTFDRGDGAAGSTYYDFKDTAGHQLAFRFTNGPAAPTTGPASQHRITDIVYMP